MSLSLGSAAAGWSNFASLNKLADKTYNIRLNVVVGCPSQELGSPHRTQAAVIEEVSPEYFQSLSGFGLAKQPSKPNRHILHSPSVIADHVIKIVCVLAIPASVESQSL